MTKDARVYENAILVSTIDKDEMWRRGKKPRKDEGDALRARCWKNVCRRRKKDVEMYSEFNNGTRWGCNRANWGTNASETRHTTLFFLYICVYEFRGKFKLCRNYFRISTGPKTVSDRFSFLHRKMYFPVDIFLEKLNYWKENKPKPNVHFPQSHIIFRRKYLKSSSVDQVPLKNIFKRQSFVSDV